MGEGFGREWVHAYLMAESLHYLPETTTTLLIGYTPIQIGFGVKKKKKNRRKGFFSIYSPSPIWFRQGIYFLSLVKV